ncbi:MAG: glycerophosphodiester phosphodiesterase family protein [Bdellovibrionota bacterium]
MTRGVVLVIAMLFCACTVSAGAGLTTRETLLSCTAPKNGSVVDVLRDPLSRPRWPAAHRGDRDSGPDNTRAAFEAAIRAGVPLLETDVRVTTDGKLFLFHDHTLKKTNVSGPAELLGKNVTSLSSADVRQLDSNFPPSNPPSPVLFFEDALQIIARSNAALQLDLKVTSDELVGQLIGIARKLGVAHQLVVQCQSIDELTRFKTQFPDIAVLARVRTPAEVEQALTYRPEIVFSDFGFFTPELIEHIHTQGSKVGEKTMGFDTDTVEGWAARFGAGVDILMTDHATALSHFAQREICHSSSESH